MEKENYSSGLSDTAKQTASIMAGKIIALIATFAMPLFLTRFLTKYEYGIYSQFYIIINFCAFIFSLGIQSNLYFFFPKSNEQERKSLVIHTILFLMLFTLIAIGIVNIPLLSKYLIGQGDLANYVSFISLGILFILPVMVIEPLYVARNDQITSVFYPPAAVILRLIFVMGFAVCWNSLESVLYGVIVAAFLCFVFVIWYSSKGIDVKDIGKMINPELAKKQLRYSYPFGLALILNTLALQFDKIICISFLTPTAFATYTIAFYGIPGVEQIYQSLSQVYLIKMALKHHENKPNEISEIYKSLVTKTYSFSIPAIMLVLLYAKRIIVLFFTSKYVDAVPLFRIYILSFLVFMLGAGLILRATNRTIDSLKAYLCSSIITIPLTWYLIKHYGIWGGMTSAMVSILLPKAIQLYYEMKLVKSNFVSYFPWKQFLTIAMISLISIIPFAVVEYFFEWGNLMSVIFGFTYFGIVSLLEIKYKVFVFDQISIENLIKRLTIRIGHINYNPANKRN
ncbi:MAG: lipopolysaccharide biosynthesis protein [Mangrovibacterium sp.]